MLKKIILVCFISSLFCFSAFSGVVIKQFQAEPGLNRVELKWIVTKENNIKGYRILRSMNASDFDKVGFVEAQGINGSERTYKFVDRTVFKSTDSRTFYYKLQFVNNDESTNNYEKVISVTPQISSTRHTWGSIKAMFR